MMIVAAFMSEGLATIAAGLGPYDGEVVYVDGVGATTYAPRRLVVDKAVELGLPLSAALDALGLRINKSKRRSFLTGGLLLSGSP